MRNSQHAWAAQSQRLLQALLIAALLLAPARRTAAAGPDTAPDAEPIQAAQADAPVLSVGASASPSYLSSGGLVTYQITGINSGTSTGGDFRVSLTLPSGFSYRWGTTRFYINDALVSSANPAVSGRTLTFSAVPFPSRRNDSYFGINTFVQDRCGDQRYLNRARWTLPASPLLTTW